MYYLNYVLWPPHLAPPLPPPLVHLLPPLLSVPITLPSWLISVHAEGKEIIANRIKVAKYGYLHEMEPLCII